MGFMRDIHILGAIERIIASIGSVITEWAQHFCLVNLKVDRGKEEGDRSKRKRIEAKGGG